MKHTLNIGLAGLGLTVLAACGEADDPAAPPSRQMQAIVDMCLADGSAPALCNCSAKTLEASLDPASLGLLVDFAQALHQARTQGSRGLAAAGVAGDPRLAQALDQVGEAARTCERAAALEAAQVEVAAAEAARQARRARTADRRCPPDTALPTAAPGSPVDDVAGLRPGMGFEAVEAVLECSGELDHVDVKPSWARNNQGLETRQLLRAADGEVCPAAQRVGGGQGCEDGGYGFAPLHGVAQEVIVAFAGMPGAERAGAIWRRNVFPDDARPTLSSLQAALAQKYGPPHLQATQEGYYSLGHRRGTVVFSWVHDARQRPIARGDSARRQRCVNGPRPTFQRRMGWNGSCGLTVRAEVVLAPGSTVLARELNVMIIDQQRFDADVKRFEADIRAAVEARHRDTGAKPKL